VKRLVAVEGDVVLLPDNSAVPIPKGHCWVEGDNASVSYDSRHFGPIPMALIQGRVLAILFPLSRIQLVHRQEDSRVLKSAFSTDHIPRIGEWRTWSFVTMPSRPTTFDAEF
jgi:signal peptidase I